MSRNSKKLGKLLAGALLAGAVVGVVSPANAAIDLKYDLVIAGGAKSANVAIGSSVPLELYALVADYDGSAANTGFNTAAGGFFSNGAIKGDFTTALAAHYDKFGSANPAPADLDGDGDLDVGAQPGTGSGFWTATAGTSGENFFSVGSVVDGGTTYQKFLIGSGTFSVTAGASGESVNLVFLPRTSGLSGSQKYYRDSGTVTSIKGSDARYGWNGDVVLSVAASRFLKTEGVASQTELGPINVSGTPNQNWSTPLDIADSDAGSVTVNGDVGSEVIVGLWLDGSASDIAALAGELTGVEFVTNARLSDAWALQAGGDAPDWLVKMTNNGGVVSWDFGGSNVTVDQIAVVPEPASLGLLGLGALGLLARRRRA